MMNNLLCKTFVMGALICSTQLSAQKVSDKQPWSVRMVESEMIRCPESWQLDFQPKLKWDYCHGLELQAMLDVYDTYGDQKMFDYALAYADTMIHKDGSIETYKLVSLTPIRVMRTAVSGIRKYIRTRCGWMVFIWGHLSMLNMLSAIIVYRIIKIL